MKGDVLMLTRKETPGKETSHDLLTRRLNTVAAIRRLESLRLPSLAQRYEAARTTAIDHPYDGPDAA